LLKERNLKGLDRNTRRWRKENLRDDVVGKGCFSKVRRELATMAAPAKSFPRTFVSFVLFDAHARQCDHEGALFCSQHIRPCFSQR
jgi:hypothetical protein